MDGCWLEEERRDGEIERRGEKAETESTPSLPRYLR